MLGKIKGIRYGEVISISENKDSDAIQVKIYPEDSSKFPSDIPYAFPLLPKMIHIKPKVGEGVLVLLTHANDGNSQRYYIGPLISQDHKMNYEAFLGGSDAFMKGSLQGFDKAPRMNPESEGTMPNDNDVMIRGRKNTDIQITDDDIRIRAGVKVLDKDEENRPYFYFNKMDPAFIKIKYHENGLSREEDENKSKKPSECNSTATIVADRIMLLSNKPKDGSKAINIDRNDLISDSELLNILDDEEAGGAYKLPYGEKLVKLLKAMIKVFVEHTHDYSMMPPNKVFTEQIINERSKYLDNNELLSDTVRFN